MSRAGVRHVDFWKKRALTIDKHFIFICFVEIIIRSQKCGIMNNKIGTWTIALFFLPTFTVHYFLKWFVFFTHRVNSLTCRFSTCAWYWTRFFGLCQWYTCSACMSIFHFVTPLVLSSYTCFAWKLINKMENVFFLLLESILINSLKQHSINYCTGHGRYAFQSLTDLVS